MASMYRVGVAEKYGSAYYILQSTRLKIRYNVTLISQNLPGLHTENLLGTSGLRQLVDPWQRDPLQILE